MKKIILCVFLSILSFSANSATWQKYSSSSSVAVINVVDLEENDILTNTGSHNCNSTNEGQVGRYNGNLYICDLNTWVKKL